MEFYIHEHLVLVVGLVGMVIWIIQSVNMITSGIESFNAFNIQVAFEVEYKIIMQDLHWEDYVF